MIAVKALLMVFIYIGNTNLKQKRNNRSIRGKKTIFEIVIYFLDERYKLKPYI